MATSHHGYADVAHQAWMVLDRVRTDAYARAIAEVVKPGDVVLDIGAGSGLLSLFAAKAGAKRVYAVERTGMAQTAREHAEENGFGEVIEVLRKDLLDLEALEEEPDVVVSEMLGNFAPDEHQHLLYAKAKTLAKTDARFIPSHYAVSWTAVDHQAINAEIESLGNVHGVSLGAMSARLRTRVTRTQVQKADRLGPWSFAPELSTTEPLPSMFQGHLSIERSGTLSGVAAGFKAQLSPQVILENGNDAPPVHWRQLYLPVVPPLAVSAEDEGSVTLHPRQVNNTTTYRWTVKVGDQTRRMDSLNALSGDKDDLAHFFGLAKKAGAASTDKSVLAAWAAAVGGSFPDDIETMAERVFKAFPVRYPDLSAARQEVSRLIMSTYKPR